jgi:ELWxxDGT repeat protein
VKKIFCFLLGIFCLFTVQQAYAMNNVVVFEGSFLREKGKPVEEIKDFQGYSGSASMMIINGSSEDEDDKRVSSAKISLNNKEVFTNKNFKRKVSRLEKRIKLIDGTNTLSVILRSKPESQIHVMIIQNFDILDRDKDGITPAEGDCNDDDPSIKPGATEICDEVDNNCDGQVDEGLAAVFWLDMDQDGYGDSLVATEECTAPEGYVSNSTDCDDASFSINPGATEICDTVDNDCDSLIDEGLKQTFYQDSDGDTYGNTTVSSEECFPPNGYVVDNTDCNDLSSSIHPDAIDTCNGIDDDCDGKIDESFSSLGEACDGDDSDFCFEGVLACRADGMGVVCDDYTADTVEICDGLDNDCNGLTDESFDGDGDGYTSCGGDCDDSLQDINPDATDVADNGIDEDCNGDDLVTIPTIKVSKSDNQEFSAKFQFPERTFTSVQAGGETFTQVHIPGFDYGRPIAEFTEDVGKPGGRIYHRLIAIPIGAQPILTIGTIRTRLFENINLYPAQEDSVDDLDPDTFITPPFVKDGDAYLQDALFPAEIVSVQVVGQVRDVRIAQISIATAQYNPVKDTLNLVDSVEVDVAFDGGTGSFIERRAASPFEEANNEPIISQSVLNGLNVFEFIPSDIPFPYECVGEELMIITHPDFIDAANDLRDWKRQKGIITNVYETTLEDTEQQTVKDLIQGRYDLCHIRPSYVLLLGDDEFIPVWKRSTVQDDTTGTDLDYSLLAGNDLLADVSLARIPVDTADQAQIVVDKIINYERNPPVDFDFYNHAAIASYFQCCRSDVADTDAWGDPFIVEGISGRAYIETMELVRDGMVSLGYDVDRLYTTDNNWERHYSENLLDLTPRFYFNQRQLPEEISPTSGFTWDANSWDIRNAINEGRFLVIHRDHGSETVWSRPAFGLFDAVNLVNEDRLPVLFSVNCSSGLFDNESESAENAPYHNVNFNDVYLVEALLQQENGGIVGALGDTRDSPTEANDALTRGFNDAMFPSILPNYGEDISIRRLADILNYGKLYMFSQVGVPQQFFDLTQNRADIENVIWHAFGDPTQEIWTSYPIQMPREFAAAVGTESVHVTYAVDGAVITAFQETEEGSVPVGRGVVENGEVNIEYFIPPIEGVPVALAVAGENSVGGLLTSQPGPDLTVNGITIPATAVPGEDIGDALTLTVENIGDALAEGTINADGTISSTPGYLVDLVLSTDQEVPAGLAPASDVFIEDVLMGGRISRTPDIGAGDSYTFPLVPPYSSVITAKIPDDTPPGDYYVCTHVDPAGVVDESDEENNVTCSPITIAEDIQLQIKYFVGNDGSYGFEPWQTDGTPEGTFMVADIHPGPYGSYPSEFVEFNGAVFFSAYSPLNGYELYKTDGTEVGTSLMDLWTGEDSSEPGHFVVFNSMLYFQAYDSSNGNVEWWRTDGTIEHTVMIKDIWPAIDFSGTFYHFTEMGGELYFLANDGVHGQELWKMDGSLNPPTMVKDIYDGDCEYGYFYPTNLTAVDGTLYFSASVDACNSGARLWKTDGTEAGTKMVSDKTIPQTLSDFIGVDNTLYFIGYNSGTYSELWKSNGTDAGTMLVKDIEPNGSSLISNMVLMNGELYFKAFNWEHGHELWKSDGSEAGTVLVKDIFPGPPSGSLGSANPSSLTNINGSLFFAADDGTNGKELWKSDGTNAGTVIVKDITPGITDTFGLSFFTPLNGELLFRADDSFHGNELWTSNGTAEGTAILQDICTGTCDGFDGF